jgi:cell division protease FtsH
LERHRDTLDRCARELLRQETLDEAALRELTKDVRAAPGADGASGAAGVTLRA